MLNAEAALQTAEVRAAIDRGRRQNGRFSVTLGQGITKQWLIQVTSEWVRGAGSGGRSKGHIGPDLFPSGQWLGGCVCAVVVEP